MPFEAETELFGISQPITENAPSNRRPYVPPPLNPSKKTTKDEPLSDNFNIQ